MSSFWNRRPPEAPHAEPVFTARGVETPEMTASEYVFNIKVGEDVRQQVFTLEDIKRGITIGRSSDSNIVVSHADVSRNHSVVKMIGVEIVISGVGTNGTSVNGREMKVSESQPLKSRDQISLANGVCIIDLEFRNPVQSLKEVPVEAKKPVAVVDEVKVPEVEAQKDFYKFTEGMEGLEVGETKEGMFVICSNVGVERDNNEDSVGVLSEKSFFVVADGMGGEEGGSEASSIAVNEATAMVKNGSSVHDRVILDRISLAQQVKYESNPVLNKMGTTIAAFQVNEGKLRVIHNGDSRVRVYSRDGKLKFITRDHGYLQDQVSKTAKGLNGTSRDEELKDLLRKSDEVVGGHLVGNNLNRGGRHTQDRTMVRIIDAYEQLTPKGRVMVKEPEFVEEVELESEDVVIASSDGLDMTEAEIAEAVREFGNDLMQLHVKLITSSSGRDNITFAIHRQK